MMVTGTTGGLYAPNEDEKGEGLLLMAGTPTLYLSLMQNLTKT